MSDENTPYVPVTVAPAQGRFGFRLEIPPDWTQLEIPPEAAQADEGDAFTPVAVFVARYGAVVVTFSVHPGFPQASVSEWFTAACARHDIPVGPLSPGRAGDIDGVQATTLQETQAGSMIVNSLMFERGGWAHMLMAMAPQAFWASLQETFTRIFASFAMTAAPPATLPLWPADEALAPGGTAAAVAVADEFLAAVKAGDIAVAKALLAPGDEGSVDIHAIAGGGADYSLGPAKAEGELVVVEATLRGGTGDEEQVLPLVLRPVKGQWCVDVTSSINRMLGVDVNETLSDAAESFRRAMDQPPESLDDLFAGMPCEPPDQPEAPK